MALQIWLPLNGDLHNQGLDSDMTTTSVTPVFHDYGKISNNGLNLATRITCTAPSLASLKTFSITFWAIVNSDSTLTSNWVALFGYSGKTASGSSNTFRFETCYGSSRVAYGIGWFGDGGLATNAKGSFTGNAKNIWHHCCIVADYENLKINTYLNGNLVDSRVHIGGYFNTSGTFYIGEDNVINGCMQDLRIYNHALSPKEVKEISEGLILHYPLNQEDTNINLYKGTYDFSGSWNGGSGWTTDTDTYNGFTVKKRSATWAGLNQNIPCSIGDKFTISFWAKVDKGGAIISVHRSNLGEVTTGLNILGGNFNSNGYWCTTTQDGTAWKRYWATVEITDSTITYLQWRIENNVADKFIYIAGFKLERGTVATGWTPNPEDDNAFDSDIEYDCSGFGNNGTRVNTLLDNDTARNKASTALLGSVVDGTSNTITGASYIVGKCVVPAASAITFTWWAKITKYGRGGILETTSKTSDYVNGTDYKTTALANWDQTFGIYNGTTRVNLFTKIAPRDSTWHYNTITFDGNEVKAYLDGACVQTTALAGTLPAFNGIKIGIGKAGGAYRQICQYVSDLRIYVTALSANDIKELYNTAAIIDNQNNEYGYNYIESTNQNVLKTGIVENNTYFEYHIEPDGSIWQPIGVHFDPTTNKFKSSDTFADGVYYNDFLWLDAKIFNKLTSWEILWIQKNDETSAIKKMRWTQSVNPFTATYEDVAPGLATYNTSTGYTNSTVGGMYALKSSTYFCIANSSKGSWWGSFGAWNGHQGGIPAHPASGICKDGGWIMVYARIPTEEYHAQLIKYNQSMMASQFYEI